jgi:hypothetical protein
MPLQELKYATAVLPGGKIELITTLPEGSQVEVVVKPAGTAPDDCSDLVEAASTSLDFWDNPQDDAEWNNA